MKEDFTGPRVEVNSTPAISPQVGGRDDKPLLRQYRCRHLAVLGTHRGPVPRAGRKHVGAPEYFDFQFTPASPELVKFACKVTNTEIYIAVPFGNPGAGRPG
jgi:hypothetical protein